MTTAHRPDTVARTVAVDTAAVPPAAEETEVSRGRPGPRALTGLSDLRAGDAPVRQVLGALVALTVDALDEVDAASVVLGAPAEPVLVVSSSPRAQAADGAQFMLGRGPTFDAYARAEVVVSGLEVSADAQEGEGAEEAVVGCVALPLSGPGSATGRGRLGVLTLYGPAPGRPGAGIAELAAPFAARASSLVMDAGVVADLRRTVAQLEEALLSRAVIDQAKGILMARHGGTADDAFARLRELSNSGNRKLRDVAQELVGDAAADAR